MKDKTKDRVSSVQLEIFAENLLEEKPLYNIDEETIVQMREDLVDRLVQVTNKTIVENIPAEKLFDVEKLIDSSPKPSEIQAFIEDNVPELAPKLTEAYFNFRKIYLGL